MNKLITPLLLWSSLGFVLAQYENDRGAYQHGSQQQPPASILLHKQALGQDGSFNYAFAADNGLQQGEVINPDGSRKGSYSYVDPNGKTVSLSYTAGKDGFRVLNGDHVPKPPEPQQQQQRPNPNYYQQPRPKPQYQQEPPRFPTPFIPNPVPYEAYRNAPNAPAYRGNPIPYEEAYRNGHHAPVGPSPPPPPPPTHTIAGYRLSPGQYEAAYRNSHQPHHPRPMPYYQPRQYSVQEGNYEKSAPYLTQQYQGNHHRHEEPQKPHSFGNGFAFEFAG